MLSARLTLVWLYFLANSAINQSSVTHDELAGSRAPTNGALKLPVIARLGET